jgi:GntR family transcriptional regulator, transcriptional repressor for pyruvate dehydrogenase complex
VAAGHTLGAGMPADDTASAVDRFSPVRLDASEHIAREIRLYVERNGLKPGDRIGTENELAREFGVSRPTLREALRLLAGSHLIQVNQGRSGGIFVSSTANESMGLGVSQAIATMLATESVSLHELLEARIYLEVPLAGLAAEHADRAAVAEMESAIAAAEGLAPASDEFRHADSRFHKAIAEAAGNELMIAFTSWILEVLQPSLVAYMGPSLSGDDILDQHRRILRAIRRGQPAAAQRAMLQHIEHVRRVVRKLDARSAAGS